MERAEIHRMREQNPAVEEAARYLDQIPKFSREKHTMEDLRRMIAVLGVNPETYRMIHIAGTNGKGSVCAFLSSILRESGCHTAVFTSPHLVSVKERFCFDGQSVEDECFLRAFHRVKDSTAEFEKAGAGHPTYFEYLFLMFLLMLSEKPADYVILETGLGGRLDATNCIKTPVLTVITSISMDHMEYLGHTIPAIAGEKAGILKPHVPVVYDTSDGSAAAVIEKKAEELDCPILPVGNTSYREVLVRDGVLTLVPHLPELWQKRWKEEGAPERLTVPFAAEYQAANAMLALCAAMQLKISPMAVAEGIRRTVWPGRMEEIRDGVYIDGAHNEGGILAFASSARKIAQQRGGRRILLFAVVSDKEYREMAEILLREFAPEVLILTQIQYGRGLALERLEEAARETFVRRQEECGTKESLPGKLLVIPTVREALQEALREKKEKDTVFCAGSLYLVGEIKEAVKEEENGE